MFKMLESHRPAWTHLKTFLIFICLATAVTVTGLSQQQATASDTSSDETRPASIPSDKNIGANGVYDLTFDDLVFEMEKGEPFLRSMLTTKVNVYDGEKIKLSGYIRPSFKQSGLTKFVFVRDNKECCFGPGAALFDCILVRLDEGQKTDYTVRPVTIEGKFYVKEYTGPDGKVWSIYRMKNGRIK